MAFNKFELEGQEIALKEEDLLIDTVQQEGFAVESAKDMTVAIDTVITPELKLEGYLREIISESADDAPGSGIRCHGSHLSLLSGQQRDQRRDGALQLRNRGQCVVG